MKILSLFDGMACGMIAMQNAGVIVDRYVAYEIDKHAIQTATHNFPMIEECGDVFKVDFTQYEGFDWLIGGSPCTYWSIAQKNNRETEASGMGWELFSQYVRALHEAKPKFFIYENNKSMSQAIRESISQTFGFEPICINSALLSAQNRQRLYWVGRRNEDGTYSKVNVEQPQDKGILMKDILEDGITDKDKAYCLKHQAGNARGYFKKHHTQVKYEPVNITKDGKSRTIKAQYHKNSVANFCGYTSTYGATGVAERVFESDIVPNSAHIVPINTTDNGGKARTLMAGYYKYGTATLITNKGFKGGTTAVAESIRVGALPRPNGELSTSQAFRIYSTDGKSVNLTSGGGGAGGKTGLYAVPINTTLNGKSYVLAASYYKCGENPCSEFGEEKRRPRIAEPIGYATPHEWDNDGRPTKAISVADGKTYTVYEVKDGQITIKDKQYPIKLHDGYYIIRKLTVRECMRLQTVPEWYEFPVSDSQAYKMLGNGWTCDVITYLINATISEWLDELLGGDE